MVKEDQKEVVSDLSAARQALRDLGLRAWILNKDYIADLAVDDPRLYIRLSLSWCPKEDPIESELEIANKTFKEPIRGLPMSMRKYKGRWIVGLYLEDFVSLIEEKEGNDDCS